MLETQSNVDKAKCDICGRYDRDVGMGDWINSGN